MGVFGSAASFGGAAVASYLPASVLSTIFGVVVILGALRTYTTPAVSEKKEISSNKLSYVLAGILIGFFFRTSRDRRRSNRNSNYADLPAF